MSDLRADLNNVDGSAPSIQKAAGSMMRHYTRSADVAVTEWRNSLQAASVSQLLPLLYVANEVLQNSKRNRGNKFLEALSPVLGQSLVYICKRVAAVDDGASQVEKVRRTVKIWGDRRVFSIRYVNELLAGLEPFREPQEAAAAAAAAKPQTFEGSTFSPPVSPRTQHPEKKGSANNDTNNNDDDDDDDIMAMLNDDNDDGSAASSNNSARVDDADDDDNDNDHNIVDDDDDMFGGSGAGEGEKLVLDINLESTLHHNANNASRSASFRSKRRRSSTASAGSHQSSSSQQQQQHGGGGGHVQMKRRKSVLSASHLLDVWHRLVALQQAFLHSQLTLQAIDKHHAAVSHDDLQNKYVGDELQLAYKQNAKHQAQVIAERSRLHGIATERHGLEQELLHRYLPWLQRNIELQDDDDVTFCNDVQDKIRQFALLQPQIRSARNVRRALETQEQLRLAALARQQAEEEELERFRKAALAKETEAKPGMVWNPTTREYQSLDTEETWRD